MRTMLKRISALIFALILALSALPGFTAQKAAAEDGPVIRLHYHRADGKYEGWDVWLWEYGRDGAGYEFANEGGDMVATMQVNPGVTQVGFIVRTPDWSQKDVNQDQFIDIAEVLTGTVDVYVESGIAGYTKSYGGDAKVGIKLANATYNGDSTITVVLTADIEDYATAFSVKGNEGEVALTGVSPVGGGTYTVILQQELDLSGSYKITYDGGEYKVILPNIYSTAGFEEKYTYTGDDLGATWTKDSTKFRLWAPTADEVYVNLYEAGDEAGEDLLKSVPMTKDVNGTWIAEVKGDQNGVYYTYLVNVDNKEVEAIDPYARTAGVNGKRAMIIDLDSTDPAGWDNDKNPHAGENITDAIIYEGHIRDLTVNSDGNIVNRGKYIGLAETGTKTANGDATGLEHIKELGVTHLHILPMYDFGSVDEASAINRYNWGYDPVNYNVPEGSYATDEEHGEVRVAEVKTMVKALHDNGISVVMDVVYNHVQSAADFSINKIVPGYFSRMTESGSYSNGSGCGNDTASERSMVRKFIVDSVNYWADEYHIDGFRFDLVGLIDTQTINEIVSSVHEKHPDVIFYGEGWTMTTTVTKDGVDLATQINSVMTPGFAYFNDTIRDGLKGSVFNTAAGFVSGSAGDKPKIERCFTGSDSWCKSPSQTINYASCHDNNTLYDRLRLSCKDASDEDIIKMNNLAAAIYMTSEGTPFMSAGEEMLRSKTNKDGSFNSNSYNAGDTVNSLKWATLGDNKYAQVYNYYRGLIQFRKAHSVLRLMTPEDVQKYVSIVSNDDGDLVIASITGGPESEIAEAMYLIFNRGSEAKTVELPEGDWDIYIDGKTAGTEAIGTASGEAKVEPISALILCKGVKQPEDANDDSSKDATDGNATGTDAAGKADGAADRSTASRKGALAVLGTAVLAGIVTVLIKRKKK